MRTIDKQNISLALYRSFYKHTNTELNNDQLGKFSQVEYDWEPMSKDS